jgi:hypothetical protein
MALGPENPQPEPPRDFRRSERQNGERSLRYEEKAVVPGDVRGRSGFAKRHVLGAEPK